MTMLLNKSVQRSFPLLVFQVSYPFRPLIWFLFHLLIAQGADLLKGSIRVALRHKFKVFEFELITKTWVSIKVETLRIP